MTGIDLSRDVHKTCGRQHLACEEVARCKWSPYLWISGDGPYATVSFCRAWIYDRPHDPYEPVTVIHLHATEEEARAALNFIGRIGCGRTCSRNHGIFVLRGGERP